MSNVITSWDDVNLEERISELMARRLSPESKNTQLIRRKGLEALNDDQKRQIFVELLYNGLTSITGNQKTLAGKIAEEHKSLVQEALQHKSRSVVELSRTNYHAWEILWWSDKTVPADFIHPDVRERLAETPPVYFRNSTKNKGNRESSGAHL